MGENIENNIENKGDGRWFPIAVFIILALMVGFIVGALWGLQPDIRELSGRELGIILGYHEENLNSARKIVAQILAKDENTTVSVTGFLVNNSTLVSVGRAHFEDNADIHKREVEGTLPFLEDPITLYLENPVYSEDGLFAFYKLVPADVARIKSANIHYFPLARMDRLYEGQPTLFISANGLRQLMFKRVWSTTYIMTLDGKRYPWSRAMKGENGKTIGILPRAIPGDSGSPFFVLEEDSGVFAIVGMVETGHSFIRADLLGKFLAKHGISVGGEE